MTIHTIIKHARERLIFLYEKDDKTHAEYRKVLDYVYSHGKVIDDFYIVEPYKKRLQDIKRKIYAIESEKEILKDLIYEYEKKILTVETDRSKKEKDMAD